eukprot:RCo029870
MASSKCLLRTSSPYVRMWSGEQLHMLCAFVHVLVASSFRSRLGKGHSPNALVQVVPLSQATVSCAFPFRALCVDWIGLFAPPCPRSGSGKVLSEFFFLCFFCTLADLFMQGGFSAKGKLLCGFPSVCFYWKLIVLGKSTGSSIGPLWYFVGEGAKKK